MDTSLQNTPRHLGRDSWPRLNYGAQSPELVKKLVDLSTAIRKGSIEETILSLVEIRTSQLNGCAFCLDMHVKQAKLHGERELRLHHIAIWHESPLFEPRERAALDWTEALTRLPEGGVSDELYERVRGQFSDKETRRSDLCRDGDQRLEPGRGRLQVGTGLGRQTLRAR